MWCTVISVRSAYNSHYKLTHCAVSIRKYKPTDQSVKCSHVHSPTVRCYHQIYLVLIMKPCTPGISHVLYRHQLVMRKDVISDISLDCLPQYTQQLARWLIYTDRMHSIRLTDPHGLQVCASSTMFCAFCLFSVIQGEGEGVNKITVFPVLLLYHTQSLVPGGW